MCNVDLVRELARQISVEKDTEKVQDLFPTLQSIVKDDM